MRRGEHEWDLRSGARVCLLFIFVVGGCDVRDEVWRVKYLVAGGGGGGSWRAVRARRLVLGELMNEG